MNKDMQKYLEKAEVLIEALPYIQKFRDDLVVIKFGGSAMEDPGLTRRTMRDIVLLEATGMKPVVVHGGGKAITARLKELNIETKFINGLRYTCDRTIAVVDDVLHNVTNKALVDGIRASGAKGAQISGKKILRAKRLTTTDKETGEELDIGFVGQVDEIVRRMKLEMESSPKVIATGGLAELISTESKQIQVVDKYLTLKGLRILYERNQGR